ncbi:ParB family chromosome partitioning protein [Anaerobacterium chartisolvens]|uniref:ParB family chromosome partitioning protein n=1 Tax=Anaerobacterium chartisolvens TaxID=1297424 RepID=A0A369BH74_9FIRM|nr:ParB/RepB/Spo0J family partition protein [Anaerobacterium chartisolvens]RCX20903.1 ParB family chromosome partitioning protein [Anaerobacterium chartisolvens]
MIESIDINKIYPHPNNPRKDLGDLYELAESIKGKGILQNLTVVPRPEAGTYTAIIGHRRLAAAKLAGLTEVPCVIADMDEKDQVATMLLENMQRNDLTIWEQAQGMQLMLDLGETVNDISQKTGFSYSTVRRRVKLLELDSDKLKASVERGATLMDYAELDKIQDVDLKNKVLDKIGTPNFKWELQQAVDGEKREANIALTISQLEKFATQVNNSAGLQQVKTYYTSAGNNPEVTAPDDTDTVEYFFEASKHGYITLYKKGSQTAASASSTEAEDEKYENEKYKERQQRSTALGEITKRAYQLRRTFVKEISSTKAKKNTAIIIEYLFRAIMRDCIEYTEDFGDILNIKVETGEYGEWSFESIAEQVKTQPERSLLIAVYTAFDSPHYKYYNYFNQYEEDEELNTVYDFLEKFGYELSDEERAMRDGTHELLEKNDNTEGE